VNAQPVLPKIKYLLALLLLAACNRPRQVDVISTAAPLPTSAPVPTVITIAPTLPVETPTQVATLAAYDRSESIAEIDGVMRTMRLYVPTSYDPTQPTPLVINLHGLNADPNQQWALSGMSAKADAEGFIVAYPAGSSNQWYDGTGPHADADITFLRLVIQNVEGRYNIDPKRIFVTGMSNGGGMTNRLACEAADVVAAIGPVSGAYNLWQACAPSRPIPVIAFHGLADKIAPYEGAGQEVMLPPIVDWATAWAERNGCDATPTITIEAETVTRTAWGNCQQGADVVLYSIEGMGHYWPGSTLFPELGTQAINATDVMWDFFMAHPMP
jgi:polyhydroxybutyrate depolymerase